MIASVSTLIIFSGAATPSSTVNFCIGFPARDLGMLLPDDLSRTKPERKAGGTKSGSCMGQVILCLTLARASHTLIGAAPMTKQTSQALHGRKINMRKSVAALL